jgi:hypothetical protein
MVRAADRVLALDEVVNGHAALIFPPAQSSEDRTQDVEMAFGV